MKNVLMIMALVCSFVSQTNCLLTEKLVAVNGKIAAIKADIRAGKLNNLQEIKKGCLNGNCVGCRDCRGKCK